MLPRLRTHCTTAIASKFQREIIFSAGLNPAANIEKPPQRLNAQRLRALFAVSSRIPSVAGNLDAMALRIVRKSKRGCKVSPV